MNESDFRNKQIIPTREQELHDNPPLRSYQIADAMLEARGTKF